MAVYQVALVKLTNRTPGFMEYVKKSEELLKRFGGEYVVRGPATNILEGDYLQGRAVVVSKWPSMEKVQEFWNSEEYQKHIKPLRENTGVYDIATYTEAPK
ncbi:MAG: DUF1330 domain-containing protein [Rhodospirillaceae bacterium]|nr:DUF1330 domain-containing protein [Rhodospirillaceae bacterium]